MRSESILPTPAPTVDIRLSAEPESGKFDRLREGSIFFPTSKFFSVQRIVRATIGTDEPMGNAVVIKNGYARRIDPKTGSDRGSVGGSGAVAAASDGDVIVVAFKDGRARRFDASTGSDKGSVGSSDAVGCNVSGGIIILSYKDGRSRRYDARSGSDKGSV